MLLLAVTVLFILPTVALTWPTNHVNSALTEYKPYCTSCHSYQSGILTLEKINGNTPLGSSVTVNQNSSFTIDFRTVGLGYGRFTVAGAVSVPSTSSWTLSSKPGGDVPWMIADQDTKWGAPEKSPWIWATAFSENNNPNAQRGVTLDDGTLPPAPFIDRNSTAHDEVFSVKVQVAGSVPEGNYPIKVWGIGTASNGQLAYNEKILTVHVSVDLTPPTAPAGLNFSEVSSSTVKLNWTASTDSGTGMDGYEIYRSTSESGPFTYIGYAASNFFTDRELLAGTNYYYKLNAVDKAGNTTWGGSGSTTTTGSAETRVDASEPATPTGLSAYLIPVAQDVYKKTVKLTWNANTEGDIAGYQVFRATSANGSYAPLNQTVVNYVYPYILNEAENVVMNSVYFVDSGIRFGTTYYYKVKAVDVAGKESGFSSFVSATPAVDLGDSNPHGEYKSKKGMCQNCHSLHSSSGKELIFKSSITDSCYTCHDGSQSKYNTRAAFDPVSNPSHHKIPEGRYACDVCHNPHYNATEHPRLLAVKSEEDSQIKRSGSDFCWGCHGTNSDLQNPFGRDHHTPFLASKHNTLNTSSQITQIVCRNCHVAHGSRDYPLLVSANADNFCISCHKNLGFTQTKVLNDNDTVLSGVYLNNFSNNYIGTQHNENFYGRNTCTMCHDPHGNESNRYMLMYPYNDHWTTSNGSGKILGPVDYTGNQQANMVCFRCHDSQYYAGINGDYTKVTLGSRFGNGNAKNYHDHSAKLQISCRACHDPHSGQSAYQGTTKLPGYPWTLNNELYINFDWAVQVGIATYSSQNYLLGFLPKYDVNFNLTGYSCAINCHGKDHKTSGGNYLAYSRTTNSPPVKCNGCHDFDLFNKNSRHPVLGPISTDGNMVQCEQCHIADHMQHTKTNPYGLQSTIVTNWVYNGSPQTITTTLRQIDDPASGKKISAYGEFCWQCHGDTAGRNILGDHKTKFEEKPHSLLQRSGSNNPYGSGLDAPCLTCHQHHSSTNVRLIRTVIDGQPIDAETSQGKINACLACHDGSPAPYDIKSKYTAATSAGHFIKSDPTKKLLCTECHDSHGTSNAMYLLDTTNKYNTGISFEGGHTLKGKTRWFCLKCHPTSDQPARVYNTVYTSKAGEITLQPLPYPERISDHRSTGTRECGACHDPHKPWPPAGGEDKCYDCHSRPNGEATDIKSLMGLTTQPGSGLLSHHPISDADTTSNTCTTNCHAPHPHDNDPGGRADHLKHINLSDTDTTREKTLCLNCHNRANPQAPYTIDVARYDANPHNYSKIIRIYPADNSLFYGNCDKCHTPHGSNFKPMLRNRKDQLCLGCHDGVETNPNTGNPIPDIKTMYTKAGHKYKNYPTAKLYCDECHIPHGSSNDKYLRDSEEKAPRQSLTYVGQVVYSVYFPDNLIGAGYSTRKFCTTCHREYVAGVSSWVYYSSETTPGGQVNISNIPLIGPHGVRINEHTQGNTKPCTDCHNPHDPEPVGSNKDCFICHGYASGSRGYAVQQSTGTVIEELTGLNGTWPSGITPKTSFHPIKDASTAILNDCMNMCHLKHVHSPRANLIKDKRPDAKDITAPAAPTLAAVPSSANQVDVKVYAPSNTDVVGYYVYRSTDNINWSKYATINSKIFAPASLWFYDGGLRKDQTVYYKAIAFDRRGNNSVFSAVTSATPGNTSDTTQPDIPLNVTAALPDQVSLQSTSIVVGWSTSRDNYKMGHYNIYRASANPENLASYTLVGSAGGISFTDGTLAENTTYYYRVTAVDAAGNESPKSAWVSAKTGRANQVTPGLYTYIDGPNTVTMRVYKTDDANRTPTNTFNKGDQIKVEIVTPKNYFSRTVGTNPKDIYYANLNFYATTNTHTTDLNNTYAPYGSPALSKAMGSTATTDIYWFTGQAPLTGSTYQLTVDMGVYSYETYNVDGNGNITGLNTRYWNKRLLLKEAILVTPASRIMKTYSDAGYTQESLVFKPGDTVYMKVPGIPYPTSGTDFWPTFVGLWVYNGSQTGLSDGGIYGAKTLFPSDYDAATGFFKKAYTLPSSGLVNNTWYAVGLYGASNYYSSFPLVNLFKDILIRIPDTTSPSAPSGLAVGAFDQHKVSLSWSGSTDNVGVAGYNIYVKKSTDTSYVLAGSTAADTLNFDVKGLNPNTAYNFKVTAFDAVGNDSGDSNVVNKTTADEAADTQPPNPPAGVSVIINSSSSITVSWDWNTTARMDEVTAYSVYRSQNNLDYLRVGSVCSVGLTGDQRVSFTDNYLFGNTTYYYKVVAHDRVGNSSVYTAVNSKTTKRSGDDSVEGALCLSCHEGTTAPPPGYTVSHKIGSAYRQSKHNSDYDIMTFKDGSVYKGNCTKCHLPHGSDFKHLLKKDDGTDLCFTCHESASEAGKYSGKRDFTLSAHGRTVTSAVYHSTTPKYWPGGTGVDSSVTANTPDDAGKCRNCHAPHGRIDPVTGQYIKSSLWAGSGTNSNRLCFTCHSDDPGTIWGEWHGKTVYSATYHGDATVNAKMHLTDSLGVQWGAGECTNCHDPHGTQNPSMLRYPVNVTGSNKNQLCLKCHDNPEILADTGLFDGSAVYVNSKHGQNAQWLEDYNVGGVVYNKTSFLPGVCLNCHNSHGKSTDNSADAGKVIKKMLVIPDGPDNEICNKCHEDSAIQAIRPGYAGNTMFQASAHHGGSRPGVLWPGGTYYSEANTEDKRGKCINCHDPHGSAKIDQYGNVTNIPGATFDEEEKLCYACHKAGMVIPEFDLARFDGPYSGHWPGKYANAHSFGEDLNSKPRHVECLDCHNVHIAESTYGITNLDQRLPKVLKGNWGIRITSWPVPNIPDYTKTGVGEWREKPVETDPSKYPYEIVNADSSDFEEYMLCFKCHASYAPATGGKRVVAFMNPKNMSSHGFRTEKNPANFLNKALSMTADGKPVADYLFTPGSPFNPNPDINVLGESRRFKVTCSDCHGNSDTNGPKGPHGSNYDYILKVNPLTTDFCTACHYYKAYLTIDTMYRQYSFFDYHGHFASSATTFYGSRATEARENFAKYFGNNGCRLCHFAGQLQADVTNVSTHGENASFKFQAQFYDTTSYRVYRGMNGFILSKYSTWGDGMYDYSSCSTSSGDGGLSCGAH